MKINLTNESEVLAAINEAEGKSRTRLMDYDALLRASQDVEERLESLGIPKRFWDKISFNFSTNAILPDSYKSKGTAYCTIATCIRGSQNWFVINVSRIYNLDCRAHIRIRGLETPEVTSAMIRNSSCLI